VFVTKGLFPKEKDIVRPYHPTSVVIKVVNAVAQMTLTSKMDTTVIAEAANSNLIVIHYSTLVTQSVESTESHQEAT